MSDQMIVTQEQFEDALQYIETFFTKEVSKAFQGLCIYVNFRGFNNQKRYVNTTVSDLLEVCQDLSITWIEELNQRVDARFINPMIYSLRLAKKREFNTVKFIPKNTLYFAQSCIIRETKNPFASRHLMDEENIEDFVYKAAMPIRQDETLVKNNNQPIDYIEKNAFKNIEYGTIYSLDKTKMSPKGKQHEQEMSVRVQRIIELYYDLYTSWAIVYIWNGIAFLFSMEQPFIKEVLKKRDKQNGRRPLITTVVKRHTRKGTPIGSFLRDSTDKNPVMMNGRAFHIFVGEESYAAITDTESGRKRLLKDIEEYHLNLNPAAVTI